MCLSDRSLISMASKSGSSGKTRVAEWSGGGGDGGGMGVVPKTYFTICAMVCRRVCEA